jgi:hypothetical protein
MISQCVIKMYNEMATFFWDEIKELDQVRLWELFYHKDAQKFIFNFENVQKKCHSTWIEIFNLIHFKKRLKCMWKPKYVWVKVLILALDVWGSNYESIWAQVSGGNKRVD